MGNSKDLQVCSLIVAVIVFTLCNPISVHGQAEGGGGGGGSRRQNGNGNGAGAGNDYDYNAYEDYEYAVEEYEEGTHKKYLSSVIV